MGSSSKKKKTASAQSDDDDDDDKKEKKKKKKKADDEDESDASDKDPGADKKAAAGITVPGGAGFIVPSGGAYSHMDEAIGDKRLVIDTYAYAIKDYPRAKLHTDFESTAKTAGWTCTKSGATDYDCAKDGTTIGVLFGEAGEGETKINVFPARAGAAPTAPATPSSGGATVFAGTYASAWGNVVFTQKAAEPSRVLGRYPKGSLVCTPQDQKLDCSWAESGAAGRARFTKGADGNMIGSWGNGGSSSSGGAWNLTLKTPGAIE
jgi:hypothetical protein